MPNALDRFPSLRRAARVGVLAGACVGLTLCRGLEALDAPSDKELARERLTELVRRFENERTQAAGARIETIEALGELKTEQAADFLIRNLELEPRENQSVLVPMVHALGAIGSEDAVEAVLTHGFRLLEEAYYKEIGDALAHIKDPKAVSWLVTKGWKSIPSLPPTAQVEFVRALEGTGDPRRARGAGELLGNAQCPPEIQRAFVRMLRKEKDKSAARKIARIYQADDRDLKVEALLALRDLEATAYSDLFRQALKSSYWQVRSVAVDIVAGTHQPELLALILPLLEDSEPAVRISVVQALRSIGGAEVMEPLIAALERGVGGRLNDDIGDALVWLTGVDWGVDPVAWRTWWQQNRETAKIQGISREEFERIKAGEEQQSTGLYYGLRILSEYVTFIVDVSASMEEPYNVEEETERAGDGKGGTTGVGEKGKLGKSTRTVTRRKIDVAKRELIQCLRGLSDGTHFNIFKFSGDFHAWQPALVAIDTRIRNEAIAWVEALGPGGTTNVFDTLESALKDQDVNTIYFLSDGAPTAGSIQDTPGILGKIGELNQARKVKIHTIGLHLDSEAEKLMQGLAEQNFGRYIPR